MRITKTKDFAAAEFAKIMATFVMLAFVCSGFAQEKQEKHYARPVTLEADSTVKIIKVYTFDHDSTIRWIDGTKHKPDGTITDSSFYFLMHDAYLPTMGEKSGNMLYDGEMIPLDGIVYNNIKVSNYSNRKEIEELPELKPSLEWQRTVFRFKDTLTDKPQYARYRDSIIKVVDSVFLCVESSDSTSLESDMPHHFAVLTEDLPKPIKRKAFVIGDTILLDSVLINQIFGNERPKDDMVTVGQYSIPMKRVTVASRGCPYSFVKEYQFVVKEDRTTVPPITKKTFEIPWWAWIVIGVLLLSVIGYVLYRFVLKPKFDSGRSNQQETEKVVPETIEGLKKELEKCRAVSEKKIEELNKDVARLGKENEEHKKQILDWKSQTGYDTPAKAKKDIEDIAKVKRDPKSLKGDKEFDKLSQLVLAAEESVKVRKKMNDNPDEIDPKSLTGILVRKGRLLDEAKDDVALIRKDADGWFGDCELKSFIEYIVNPDAILQSTTRTNTGLYKLMYDVESLIAPLGQQGKSIDKDKLQYNWLKHRLANLIDGYNDYLTVEQVASDYGTQNFNTSGLHGKVKQVFDNASSYLEFGAYQLYWKNIASPLFNVLDSLQANTEIDNTRALMFYTSQFYSIACVMNEIYGDSSYSTTRPKLNVSLFNTNEPPELTDMGFPQLDQASLEKCRFEYKGAADDDARVKYLQRYKPLPFILVFSYYDDKTLS